MSVGREFQIVGPVTSKLRGPKRIVFDRGMIRSPRVADRCPRRPATLAVDFNISERYGGADPCMQLYYGAQFEFYHDNSSTENSYTDTSSIDTSSTDTSSTDTLSTNNSSIDNLLSIIVFVYRLSIICLHKIIIKY